MLMPHWLPHIVSVDGQPERVFAMLYQIFTRDFVESPPLFRGRPILWDGRVLDGLYEEGFWHLITKQDQESGERFLDPRRAERLPWCAPTICHSTEPTVKVWNYREGNGRIRTYLWLENFDYLIVLEIRAQRRGEVAFLFTAFHVDGASYRRSLQSKYEKREF
jgi:hypothetical protein